MGDDIFSDEHTPLDTSGEALEALTVDADNDAAVMVAEHDAELEADEELLEGDEADEDGPALGEDDGEDEADEEDEPAAADAVLDHDLVKGKSPEELAKLVVDSQSMVGRQSAEVAELRRITEEQAAQMRELIGYLNEAQQPQFEVDSDNLVAKAVDNPRGAYGEALQLLDNGHITPDVIEQIIEATEDMDPRLARKMEADFTRRMVTAEIRAEFRAELDKTVKPLANNDYQSQLNIATSSLYSDPALGEDAKAYQEDVVKMLKGQRLGDDARQIRAKLESALTVARGNDPTKSAAYRKALEAMRLDSQTDAGNSQPPPAKKSEADEYRERVMRRAAERDPGAALFA